MVLFGSNNDTESFLSLHMLKAVPWYNVHYTNKFPCPGFICSIKLFPCAHGT